MAKPSRTSTRSSSALPPIAIVVSRYNATVTDRLLQGAAQAYRRSGGNLGDLYIAEAAGAFEIVPIAIAAAESGAFAGVLTLGCIIKGETRHDEFLGHAVTQRLADIPLLTGVPVGLGVLTVNTPAQALARAGGGKGRTNHGNKGEEAMLALLQTVGEVAALRDPAEVRRSMVTGLSAHRLMGSRANVPDKVARAKKGAR